MMLGASDCDVELHALEIDLAIPCRAEECCQTACKILLASKCSRLVRVSVIQHCHHPPPTNS
jgi:hypothetical protein